MVTLRKVMGSPSLCRATWPRVTGQAVWRCPILGILGAKAQPKNMDQA